MICAWSCVIREKKKSITFQFNLSSVSDERLTRFTLNVAATLVKLAILPPMINTFPGGNREEVIY